MNTPRTLRVSPYTATFPRSTSDNPTALPRIRYRWRAELSEAGCPPTLTVEGYHNPDDAIGALIRLFVCQFETHDEVIGFIAGLFGNLDHRTAEVTLARAVRFANTNPKRLHAGVQVNIEQPPLEDLPTPSTLQLHAPTSTLPIVVRPTRGRKGGAS